MPHKRKPGAMPSLESVIRRAAVQVVLPGFALVLRSKRPENRFARSVQAEAAKERSHIGEIMSEALMDHVEQRATS